jgi:hypothetical protein
MLAVLPHIDLIGFAAYVLAIVFLTQIVIELADRQRIRFKWLTAPVTASGQAVGK